MFIAIRTQMDATFAKLPGSYGADGSDTAAMFPQGAEAPPERIEVHGVVSLSHGGHATRKCKTRKGKEGTCEHDWERWRYSSV